MADKLVSVIVTTYNRELTLPKTLYSLLNQTYKNWELIIWDDGSTDHTREVLLPFLRDKRVKAYFAQHRGRVHSLICAAEKVTGDYITILDSDDWLELDTLEKAVNTIQGFDLLYAGYNLVDNHGLLLRKGTHYQAFAFRLFKTKLFKEVGGYNPFFKYAMDEDLWQRMKNKGDVVQLPEYLLNYRQGSDTISHLHREEQDYYYQLTKTHSTSI